MKTSTDSKSRKLEDPQHFLHRIIRHAAARASMASWGLPFEAIASWIIVALGRENPGGKMNRPD